MSNVVSHEALCGIGYRRKHRDALLSVDALDRPEILEIIPDHFARRPDDLSPLAERYPIVLHDVGLSIGTVANRGRADDVLRARAGRVRELIAVARPLFFSDHLAMTVSPSGIDLGHLCPIWYTHRMLDHVVDRVRAWQDLFGVPILLENIAAPFVIPHAEMSEAEFFCRLVERTSCGILLDLSNLLANARNFDFVAAERLRDYPLCAVKQVHLAGGVKSHGFWVDSHDREVDDASYELLRVLRPLTPHLRVVIVERDDHLPELAGLVAESRRAREALLS